MKAKKELPLLSIVIIPFIYLAYIWNDLPETIPTHWNWKGEIDDWGNKSVAIILPFLLPFLTYLLFLVIPLIDPKKKIQTMGKKYENLKFMLTLFMSVLAVYILYSIKEQSIGHPNAIIFGISILYIILGNYMKTIKANYFIGIRTPWTLENEQVWNATHLFAGKLWFFGGLLLVVSSLIFNKETMAILFITITIIITVVPIIYSYLEYKKSEK